MSHNEWYKYAYVDYFSSFLKLWIAFNSWYEQNYIKDEIWQEKLKESYDALKSETIKPFDILKAKWLIDEVDNKIIINNQDIQRRDVFLSEFKEIIEEKILDFWSILVLDKLRDSSYVKKIWDDYNEQLDELFKDESFSKNLFYLKEKIADLYENDKKISFKDEQEEDILSYINSINILEWFNIWIDTEENKYSLKINESKSISWDFTSEDEMWNVLTYKKIEIDEDEIIILNWFDLKTILLLIYFIRNKLVHWEINPSNDKHYEVIKLSFYIMDNIFKYLTK